MGGVPQHKLFSPGGENQALSQEMRDQCRFFECGICQGAGVPNGLNVSAGKEEFRGAAVNRKSFVLNPDTRRAAVSAGSGDAGKGNGGFRFPKDLDKSPGLGRYRGC